MKKIFRNIKLKKFKCKINEESIKKQEGTGFIVCFDDDKYVHCFNTWDLRRLLERDHIRRIHYIFDLTDRIIISRDVLINTDELKDSDNKDE